MSPSPSESVKTIVLDLSICRIEIAVQDPTLQHRLAALSSAPEEASQSKRTLRYRIRGSGPLEIHEERDRLAQVDGVETAVAMVLERGLRRAAELLALSAWAPFTGRIEREETRLFALIEPASHGPDLLPARQLWVRGEELLAMDVSTSALTCRVLDLRSIAGVVVVGPAAGHDQSKDPQPAELIAHLLRSSPRLGAPRSALIRAASRLASLPSLVSAEGSIDDALDRLLSPSPPDGAM